MSKVCENCGECCLETEMILSLQDINLIIKSYPDEIENQDFALKNKDGNYQIKNVDNHCIFLDFQTKQCKIYEYRPQGCRFYPLIYDFEKKNCIIDEDCPRPRLFYQNKRNLKETCKKLKGFIKNQLKIDLD
ncbi:MAG: YkgJ family cysteine cluster protein [Candidatus Hermodarchaeota archaeon]